MRLMAQIIERLSGLAGVIAAFLIGVAIIIVCQMVFLRYVLVQSTAWQTEVVTFSLIASTLLGSAWVLKVRGHVAVELATAYAPPKARRLMRTTSDLVVFIFAALMFWKGTALLIEAWDGNWTTESIYEFPLWIPYLSLPLGFGLLALQALVCASKVWSGEDLGNAGGH